jgi:diguanylate cyclase (GGDEF)-like protein/PAS domain S-box-containing protein
MTWRSDVTSERQAGELSRWRAIVTVLVTLGIVCGEFLFLAAIYRRADPVRAQQVAVSRFAGQVESAAALALAGGDPVAAGGAVDAALRELRTAGLSRGDLRAVTADAQPTQAAGWEQLVGAAEDLSDTLADRVSHEEHEADAVYAGLILFVSVGWFFWFRKLVTRHRGLQREVTEHAAAMQAEQRLSALVHHASDVTAVLDADTVITFVTASCEDVLGRTPDDLRGRRLFDLVHSDDLPELAQRLATTRPGDEDEVRVRMLHADGRELVVDALLNNLLLEPSVGGLVMTLRDTTERNRLERELTHQAFHDSLTGLANRQLFTDRLGHALQTRRGAPAPLAVLFLDLDDFKVVNDSLGHSVGDQLLAEVGRRIADTVRSGDTAARLGGDEFAVLLEDSDLASAEAFAGRLLTALDAPFLDTELSLRVSIGVAPGVPGEATAEETLRNADVAMYLAKDRGKGTVATYEPQLHADALDRLALRGELQRTLRGGADELVLFFQPTVRLSSGQISGFEALVRWQHPERGLLSPDRFIPMAEETGMILPLGTWVLQEACRAAVSLGKDDGLTMAVNISARQLGDPGFLDVVTQALRASGLSPNRLVLEITETAVLGDLNMVTPKLKALRARGIRVAVDDFGTGYSSLSYLSNLPVDVLKVDKSFIDRVAMSAHAQSVADAILAMGRNLSLQTVAEGVEMDDQAAWLRAANCDLGQGYLWSRPVPLDAALALVRQGAPTP